MTWWGDSLNKDSREPTRKNRFIIEFANGGKLLSVSSVGKPKATVETKEYRLINHYYNYPGLVKWEPISIKFVDIGVWGDATSKPSDDHGTIPAGKDQGTADALWEMLLASGYTTPNNVSGKSGRALISSPEKAATMGISFGDSIKIHQLNPNGTTYQETWELFNPIIKSITWGELDYGDDGLVQYSLDISYDWAEFSKDNNIS